MAVDAQNAYNKAIAITPSNSVNFDGSTTAAGAQPTAMTFDAIYVGGAGVVALVLQDGSVVNFTAVAGGFIFVRGIRVNLTNTTATLMVALQSI